MDRTGGSMEFHQARGAAKEVASSRGQQSGGRQALVVGDEGSGRCGICSAHVAVRGVLDCCSHEYCFDCIENWSSVSNLCPLCKLQFRFISVENVHDQESDIVENLSAFPVKQEREEKLWDNESALPFSFPSFFIDEDAVACLEGGKCLVRAGVPLPDEDAADTSVACDSCDRWYHAGCVGFDPSISWGSWLCPRCSEKAAAVRPPPTASLPIKTVVSNPIPPVTTVVSNPVLPFTTRVSNPILPFTTRVSYPSPPVTAVVANPILPVTTVVSIPVLPITTVVSSSTSGRVPVAELAYNATVISEDNPTVSVSVVGEGESAIMLSSFRAIGQASTFTDGKCPGPRGQDSIVIKSEEIPYIPLEQKAIKPQAPGLSVVEKLPVSSVPSISKPEIYESMRAESDLVDKGRKEAINFLTLPVTSVKDEARDLAILSLETVQLLQSEEPKTDQGNAFIPELGVEANFELPASYFGVEANEEFEEKTRKEKRKQSTRQDRDIIRAEDLPEPPRKIARSAVKKAADPVKGSTSGPPDVHSPKDSTASITNEASPAVLKKDDEVSFPKDVPLEDLVLMVKDKNSLGAGVVVKDEHNGGTESNSAGGVRTRLVMRREADGRAAQIVEEIRQQMRAAVGCGAADDHGKVAVSDERFFSAFKAAMVCNQEENQAVKSQGLKRRRNSWLSKMLDNSPRGKAGGVRESLTKKLYAGGVPRKMWDRDWDISFWKEQSARTKKAKQEASDVVDGRSSLQVEDVVKDEVILQKLKSADAEGDSILNRLYVADTSLFPRDSDIKPLISMIGDVKEEGKPKSSGGERATSESKTLKSQTNMGRKFAETKPIVPSRAGGASTNEIAIPSSEKSSKGTMKRSGLPAAHNHAHTSSTGKAPGAPDPEEKKDKRRWALELLARRSGDAVTSSSATCPKKESSLLGQVPDALKPTLLADCRSRVPTAVRQSHLNRILEHYLRKAKLSNFQGGYKLKSVIASAVAKEFEIYENSNSKGVYLNLCVRALAQQDEVRLQVDIPEVAQPDGAAAAVTEALLATGLISDSTRESPCENQKATISADIGKARRSDQVLEHVKEASQPSSGAGDIENVLEIPQHVSSDTFDDMYLDLEVNSCEGTVAASAQLRSPTNKMKVVLTTARRNSTPTKNEKKTSEEPSTGREGTVAVVSPSSHKGKRVDELVNLISKIEINTRSKGDKECSGEVKSGSGRNKKTELETKLAVRSSDESDGDDWMDTGKFPDLDTRIYKMRKDVLKMNPSFPSQFGEEHVFGVSVCEPNEAQAEGGKTAKPSSDARNPKRKANGSNPGDKESDSSASVQKQVEAYVKEHLKPLFKSGVINSDQFRYAVSKTASKVMQHHEDATSADFLIVEGSKVKKLAVQYLQSYVHKK